MSDRCTYLVNRNISIEDAPDAARNLHRRLVEFRAIDPVPSDNIPLCLATAFAVRPDCPHFDAPVPPKYPRRPHITGVAIEVTDHEWRSAPRGAELTPLYCASGGLFFNYDVVEAVCPRCGHVIELGPPGSEPLYKALDGWCSMRDRASVDCPSCANTSPLREWGTSNNSFVGHLAIGLWGGLPGAFIEEPQSPSVLALRRLLGDEKNDYAVIYCHI
jgi:endogenous inhibitor of DNA gyrase (YacG/DUF329 family)